MRRVQHDHRAGHTFVTGPVKLSETIRIKTIPIHQSIYARVGECARGRSFFFFAFFLDVATKLNNVHRRNDLLRTNTFRG